MTQDQGRTSSALEVKGKMRQAGIVGEALTISEVARRTGVATSALRFYEDQRLSHPERTDSGHRRYPRAVLRLVAFIVFAQKVGLSLEEIRAELAKLPRHRVPERSDWAKLSAEWKRRIRERIAELERLEAGLTECIGCGCLSLDRCALANPGDRAARRGAGPRYWIEGRNRDYGSSSR
jgi:MerR family redox-sensitive transcriptional activator SoxR